MVPVLCWLCTWMLNLYTERIECYTLFVISAGKNIWEEGPDSEDNLQFDRRKFPYQV